MRNIEFYNASAGSGKTHTIAREIIRKIDLGLAPGSVIATTFTNDAADELKERLRSELIKQAHFNEAVSIGNALIGTVNSIGGQLLERFSYFAGLPPKLTVLDENGSAMVLDKLIASHITPDFLTLAERLSQDDDNAYLRQVHSVINLARINNMTENSIRNSERTSCEDTLKMFGKRDESNSYRQKIKSLVPLMQDFIRIAEEDPKRSERNAGGKRLTNYGTVDTIMERLKSFIREGAGASDPSWGERFDLLNTGDKKLPESYRDLFYKLYHAYYPLYQCVEFHEDMNSYYRGIFETALAVQDEYASYKAERGLIDFTDQEHMLWKLLSENETVRTDISGNFELLVVDEFQDTSPIQLALFLQLNSLVKGTIWVGDPKQSVFGFRGADMSLMEAVIREVDKKENSNSTSELGISWRSRQELVSLANALFTEPFGRLHKMTPERVCLEVSAKRRVTPEKLGPAFQVWKLDGEKAKTDPHYYNRLAARVKQVLDEKWPFVVKGKEKEGLTDDVKGKDIALLFHLNKECRRMAASLTALGMPVCSKSAGLFSEPESLLLTSLLKVADNPSDTLSVAEVLLFEAFDGSQEGLLNARLKNVRDSEEDLSKRYEWGKKESTWIRDINDSDFLLRNLSLYDRAAWITGSLGVNRLIAGWPNPGQRMANLEQYLGFLRQYDDQCTALGELADIHGFIRFASRLAEKEKDNFGYYTDENTVTVSTFHAAKGLEWPLVIINDFSFQYDPGKYFFGTRVVPSDIFDATDPLKGRRICFWMKPFDRRRNLDPEHTTEELKSVWEAPRGQGQAAKEQFKLKGQLHEETSAYRNFVRMTQQEELRKFYVAFTRARDYIILPFSSSVAHDFWHQLGNALGSATSAALTTDWGTSLQSGSSLTGLTDTYRGKATNVPVEVLLFDLISEEDTYVTPEYETPLLFSCNKGTGSYMPAFVSPSAMEKEGQGGMAELVTRLPAAVRLLKNPPEAMAAEFGDCIHGFFAAAAHFSQDDYQLVAARVLSNYHFEEYLSSVSLSEYAKAFFNWIRLGKPLRIDTELPVRFLSDEGQLFSGSVDMLVTYPEKTIIIDHKTINPSGSTKDEVLARLVGDRFSLQLATYKRMLQASGINADEMYVHLPLWGYVYRLKEAVQDSR